MYRPLDVLVAQIEGLLLVQLVRALLELLLAGWLAKVVGDDGTRVGLVVLEGSGAAAACLGVDIVDLVRRCGGVLGLLCDLVGDACSSVNHVFAVRVPVSCLR